MPICDQHTNLNTNHHRLVSTLDHHVLNVITNRLPHHIHTNFSASHPVQQLLPLTYSGLTTHAQSTLSVHHHGIHIIASKDIYEVNYNSLHLHSNVTRRKAISSNRYHPWRTAFNNLSQDISWSCWSYLSSYLLSMADTNFIFLATHHIKNISCDYHNIIVN